MTYLSDVPTVDLDPRLSATIAAGIPGVQLTPTTPQTISVKLPSFDKPRLSSVQFALIGGAVALYMLSGNRRRR